jgi:hypothetical protein
MSEKQIHSLRPAEYKGVRSLFAELAEVHPSVIAVLEGHCPGEVYVDDVAHPRTAYLVSGDGYYLARLESDNFDLRRKTKCH